jgi:hypothetical protein
VSEALEKVRSKYEAAPRKLDATLDRLARGDRGCLPDIVSGVGVLTLLTFLILSGLQLVGFRWVYLGAAMWIGGFFWGSYMQAQSGVRRKKALERGPLVEARTLWRESHLGRKGRQVGAAVVLFRVDEEGRFDLDGLEALAERLAPAEGEPADCVSELVHREPTSEITLKSEDADPLVRVPEAFEPVGESWLARVVVYPDRLEARKLERGDPLLLIVDPGLGFVEHIPATL